MCACVFYTTYGFKLFALYRTTYLEHTLGDMQSRESGLANVGGHYQGRPVFGNHLLAFIYEIHV